ncbi:MAG: phosphoenolpyruvate carboxylase [Streptosporangiales bacterium]|nr:phosphoenolpyruvate carboxylase [Streptosporangiales bacterium]MBO0890979.1 phosphoenolpyruvate carboxylase [Acidothermales bacterium]
MPEDMRRDVRLLGDTLGRVLSEQGGADLLEDVEALRHAVIAAAADPAADDEARRLVESWPIERAEQVARAFTCYFHLANLAEEHQRARTIRARERSGVEVPGSLASTVASIGERAGERRLAELVGELRFHPVLTAHPTEARRRAVVTAIRRVGEQLAVIDDPGLSAAEEAEARRRLFEEVDGLWRTALLRQSQPDPLDEVRTAMAVFDDTLFRTVPALYRGLDTALAPADAGRRPPRAPAFLRLGSWVGGDRDGNPFVTSQVTREAVLVHAEHVLHALENAATRIGRTLTAGDTTTPPSERLRRLLGRAAAAYPDLSAAIAKRSPAESHRQALLMAAQRIRATRERNMDLAYRDADELSADLAAVQESLAAAGAVRLAYGELQHLVWQVETFGFHLAELEIRQHSEVHERALAEVRAGGDLSAQTDEVLQTLRVMAWIQERFGVRACRRYVVSFTRSAADVAAVHELAAYATDGRAPVLDVVPLFETGADLAGAVDVLDEVIGLDPVRRRLAVTGGRLEVMLGYSDSAKDIGPVSATLLLYDVQAALAAWAKRQRIRLVLFHGRGGALGRGGGPANRAVLAQAPGSVAGTFKVTEQGEVVFARYGNPAIARRHIEQVSSAVLMASTEEVERRASAAAQEYRGMADAISAAARETYAALVAADGFAAWFARVSPLQEIGSLRIGSRPARRGGAAQDLSGLRAIPWVFAWSQTRINLPGWYGLGSGLAAVDDVARLREAYREWPLFASLLDNAQMSLAKTDRRIAARYLALGDRPDLTARVLDEYDRTVERVLAVTGNTRLLEQNRVLSLAVQLRNPYVDALSHLQLRALTALRRGEPDDGARAAYERLLQLTVNGVAAGLQNTG